MKKAAVILLMLLMCFCFTCCGGGKTGTDVTYAAGKAQISIDEGEMFLTAKVKQVNGDSLLLENGDGEYVFDFSSKVDVVKNDEYIRGVTAKSLEGKSVMVIVSSQVQETWPMGLTGERVLIITE